MADRDSWEALVKEFEQIASNEEYKPFRPLLDKLKPAIEYSKTTPAEEPRKSAQALLAVIKHLQMERAAGKDVQVLVDQITGGYIQPSWFVEGDVKQASQDFIDNSTKYITNVFIQSTSELNLATSTISVPIILVVMTKAEAQELVTRSAFQGEAQMLQGPFDQLCIYLQTEYKDWLDRYGATPMAWKPFDSTSNNATIEELVTEAFNGLEKEIDVFDNRPLVPSFQDIHTLGNIENRTVLRQMRNKGCIVILDVISMRHPKLQRAFHQSLLDAYPRTSIVSIAPNQKSYDEASHLAVLIQLKLEEMEFYQRTRDPGDYGASQRFFEKTELRAWLSTRVQKIDLALPEKRSGVPRYRPNGS
jgi:hypothetical protein